MWPADPPPGYLGQLNPEFQRQLAGWWADVRLEDCYFYHSVLLPDGSFVQGPWDLIDNESEYLEESTWPGAVCSSTGRQVAGSRLGWPNRVQKSSSSTLVGTFQPI